jgi:hypothetical protein
VRATIESSWLRAHVDRWRGAITITNETLFER